MIEANLRHRSLVDAADQAIRFKLAAKQIARRHGLMATFMAQWAQDHSGCGGHIHQSLWHGDGGAAFVDGRGELSAAFHHYLAGQLETMAELCVLFNPTVNSWRRVAGTPAAPRNASWGVQNRLAAIRVIPGDAAHARIEHRRSGADCNPYLAMAGCVAGGLHGLDGALEPWPPVEGSAYDAGPDVARPLPQTLPEATARFRDSAVARKYLGDAFVDHYARTREWEAREFDRAVTDWEVRRYLEQV
jgi:glutamine synthetase